MFYKMLFLEILTCISLVSLRVYQGLPATTLAMGDTTLVIKEVAEPSATTTGFASSPSTTSTSSAPANEVYPVKPLKGGKYIFPVAGYTTDAVISVFGDKRGKSRTHQGIDIKAPKGTPVVATVNGFVERIKDGGSGGKCVYLRGAKGKLYYYAHLDDWSVEEYDAVSAGDELGTVGDTGNAKGTTPHLHFEIMIGKGKEAVDPLTFFTGV